METNKHDNLDKLLIFGAIIFNLAILTISLLWLFTNSFYAVKSRLSVLQAFEVNETITYGLFFSGMLGGSFYCLRAIYQRLGEAYTPVDGEATKPTVILNIKVWLFWYLYRPFQGGVLALILLTLINSNLMTIKTLDGETLKSFYGLVAVGFLAGFGSHELIHKIQEIIMVVFAKSKIKGTTSKEKVEENNGK